jgi:hypothetical protein
MNGTASAQRSIGKCDVVKINVGIENLMQQSKGIDTLAYLLQVQS